MHSLADLGITVDILNYMSLIIKAIFFKIFRLRYSPGYLLGST